MSRDYAEATAYLRVQEKKTLNREGVERLIDAKDVREVFAILAQVSEYDMSSLPRPQDYETVVKSVLKEAFGLVDTLTGQPLLTEIAGVKYDCNNLKIAVKARYLPQASLPEPTRLTNLPPEMCQKAVADLDAETEEGEDAPPEWLAEAARKACEAFDETQDPQMIDISIDHSMFARLLPLCEELGCEFVTRYARMLIDFTNIRILLRVKEMDKGLRFLEQTLIEGGLTDTAFLLAQYDKSPDALDKLFFYQYYSNATHEGFEGYTRQNNYSALERAFDNALLEHAKQAKYEAFGPEAPFAYLLAKENEAKQVRILLTCKLNGMPPEVIRERLRENYA